MDRELQAIRLAFELLEDEVNSTEPTVERCRDWAGILAYQCARLAHQCERLNDALKAKNESS